MKLGRTAHFSLCRNLVFLRYDRQINVIRNRIDEGCTGEPLAKVLRAGIEDYESIVRRAQDAFLGWRMVPAPQRGEVVRDLGNALRALQRPEEAIEQYQQAIVIRPTYPEAHNSLGNTLVELGRSAEAIFHYQRAITMKPDYTDARINLEQLLRAGPGGMQPPPRADFGF